MKQKHDEACRCSACFERHVSNLIAKGEIAIVTDENGDEIMCLTEKGRKETEKLFPGKERKPS